MKIACIITVPSSGLARAAAGIKEDFGIDMDLRVYSPHQIDEERVDIDALQSDLRESDAVLVDIRGSGRSVDIVCCELEGRNNIVLNLTAPTSRVMAITRLGTFKGRSISDRIRPGEVRDPEEFWKKVQKAEKGAQIAGRLIPIGPVKDAANYVRMLRYWRCGGLENYRNMLILLLGEYLGCRVPAPADPVEFPEFGIYHPEHGRFSELGPYLESCGYDPVRPTVGILFYGNMHFDQCQPVLRALIGELEEMNIVPIYSDGIHNLRAMRSLFFLDGRPIIDALVNLTLFRLNGGPLGGDHTLTKELLKELDVPVFTPASMYGREIDLWRESETGLSPIEAIIAVIWPELDGCIEPIPSCGVSSSCTGGIQATNVDAIGDRIERIASRIRNWMSLKHKPCSERRVAVVIYNYPPGEENLGTASYLDVFESIRVILKSLYEEGYEVDIPGDKLSRIFEEMAAVNSGRWVHEEATLQRCPSLSLEEYRAFFESLPDKMKEDVVAAWGEAPGDVMVSGGRLLIPCISFGNAVVGVQPSRPPLGSEDLASASHDKTKPPHHQYLAFYYWLENVFGADVAVHVGTHGLAEFTKGKEVGMSQECFPDRLIGNMPHLYFYHILNTSEVVIAKRRLYGTTIGYNSPSYTTSGLYEGYARLQELIEELGSAAIQNPSACSQIEVRVLALAGELKFTSGSIPEVHEELYEMRRRIIPQGMHILGRRYDCESKKRFLEFVLRYDRDGMKSLNRIVAESMGIDYDAALRQRPAFVTVLEAVDRLCAGLADACIDGSAEDAITGSGLTAVSRDEIRRALDYGAGLAGKYADNSAEVMSFIRGLCAEHMEQSAGGDVVRSPEVLPSGRNLTQFDPTKVPTGTAMDRGAQIASNTLSEHRARTGSLPESVGVILWGFETTKTGGESVGQILSYIGVRVVHGPGMWSPGLEVVPLEELGRPRIDCLVNMCGFFRDMFPNVVQLIDRAFNMVAGLDEPVDANFVRKHSLANLEGLMGVCPDERTAMKIANGRIFGPKAGEYGTRMLPLIEDSVWMTEEELSDVYVQSMSHLYAENIHAEKSTDLYRANLARVEMVSQVRDSNDREVVDLDHYFEFFGGLSSAVRFQRGERPQMLISDTTGEVIKTEDIKDAVTMGARTRILNPRWIDGMLQHDFHGAQQIAERVENMLGLSATTGSVDGWIWHEIAQRYIFNPDTRSRLTRNNRFAAAKVAQWLIEAQRRGYWDASDDETARLRSAYLEMEGYIEDRS